jgi:hypothetical protein
VQFGATHFLGMACLKQATAKRHLPQVRDMNLRHAERLIGTGLRLLEAMERRQDKKPSTAMVGAFLNVQPGGQAIVGMQVGLNQVDAEIDPSATVQRHHPAETRGTEQGSPFVAQDERLKRPPGAPPKGSPAVADHPRNTGPMRRSHLAQAKCHPVSDARPEVTTCRCLGRVLKVTNLEETRSKLASMKKCLLYAERIRYVTRKVYSAQIRISRND